MRQEDFDLLGQQLFLALRFAKSGFNQEELLGCCVTQEQASGQTLFFQEKNKWFMRFDSLPGVVSVKAIGVNSAKIFLETAGVDVKAANQVLVDKGLHPQFVVDSNGVKRDKKPWITFRNPNKTDQKKGLGNRLLWVMPWRSLSAADHLQLIMVPDLLYSANTFEQEEEESVSGARTQGMSFQILPRLRQQLLTEQRPELALRQEMSVGYMLIMDQRLRQMSEAEVLEEVAKDTSAEGQRRMLRLLVFSLAGKVKRAMRETHPNMTWKEARALVRGRVNGG